MMRRALLWYFALFLVYCGYLALGALIFSAIEEPYETRLRHEVKRWRARFLAIHPCLSAAELDSFLSSLLGASRYGVAVVGNASLPMRWDFVSALFFTSTTLTTTGFGHPAPLSAEGKVFCVVYCIFGIPLTLVFLSLSSRYTLLCLRNLPLRSLQLRFPGREQVLHHVYSLILLLLLVGVIFLIPAQLFSVMEVDWSFFDSLYFCFISISTIGLGDFVPGEQGGQRRPHIYKLAIIVYLMLGLIGMYVLLDVLRGLLQFRSLYTRFLPPRPRPPHEATANESRLSAVRRGICNSALESQDTLCS
ncbi:potassium channel subfamily K member 1-like [Polypterus senegalus]|uniref:potassium channel subfamily K member 1-like n=1 Tax=Polypterus senegalus TaxID=55291 RepID=UPI001965B0DB|nr:potassium channel subfamily K member 1-like [Polypterus senegalus]